MSVRQVWKCKTSTLKPSSSFQSESPPLTSEIHHQSPLSSSYNPLRDEMINSLHNISTILDTHNNPSNTCTQGPPSPPPQQIYPPSNESRNKPRDFAKSVKAIALPQDVPSTSDHRLIELKNQVQHLMEAHLAPTQPTQVNKVTTSCEICSSPHNTQYCMEDPKQAFVEYASSCTDEAGGLVSNFMASQDARLLKFKADFKQQQSKMTKKIDIVLKAITNRIVGALPSDTVKNQKLSTSPVLSARSYPTMDPQCSTHIHGSINTVTIHPKQQGESHDDKPEENEEEEKDNPENIIVLTTNTPYSSRKIRRIRACTYQRPRWNFDQFAVKIDDPNITIEKYIRLEEEKACRRVFNDTFTSEATLSCERMVRSLNNEIDFRISFDEFDDEDYTNNMPPRRSSATARAVAAAARASAIAAAATPMTVAAVE
ncbi:hypothetical protein Tco_0815900 [Tanacetum coccineum]